MDLFSESFEYDDNEKSECPIVGLSKQEGALQVNALLYAMGDESGDIFTMQTLPLMMAPSRIITIIQSEYAKKQQGVIRSHPAQVSVESLTASKSWRPRKKTTSNKLKQPSRVSGGGPKNYMPNGQNTRCERCGHHQKHNRQTCPGKDARCHKCSKQGHFAKCCRAKSRVNMFSEVELAETSTSDSEVFLGEVSANEHKPWIADIIVNN
ncbi:hypothetical protein P5673_005966 [Acropora cervicornis]|uniref:CCHC-type domain-containing protein n=1 Tax=Acropora cervicornis TaxID=6130 RepID=A0AAD9QX67_ACRCE|nr:hypothetical protein P5673_005966 [Acropora cervicornis]